MNKLVFMICCFLLFANSLMAQNTKGIHFQAIARNENGIILSNKQITIRISIGTDSVMHKIVYQEIKSVTTNVLGLMFVDIGNEEEGKVVTTGIFNQVAWASNPYFIQIEIDPNNALSFVNAGIEKMSYVPLALFAETANKILTILPIELGGTGVSALKDVSKLLNIDKVNNTPDSLKPISNQMNTALNEKLKKADTIYLSNRINAIPKIDTTSLSNRINNKMTIGTLSGSDIINGLGYNPVKNIFGQFYDSSKQITSVSTATAIRFNFQQVGNKINITNNNAGSPTRITVMESGTYQINYLLQFLKSDIGNDEVSIWIRKNSSAYPNTHSSYLIQGNNYKNIFSGNYFIELGANDYLELYFSVKNSNTALYGNVPITTTPSRPATPSAYLNIHAVN